MIDREFLIGQWFHCGLTEKEATKLVGHINGTKIYGWLVTYTALPECAKEIIRTAYHKALNEVSE